MFKGKRTIFFYYPVICLESPDHKRGDQCIRNGAPYRVTGLFATLEMTPLPWARWSFQAGLLALPTSKGKPQGWIQLHLGGPMMGYICYFYFFLKYFLEYQVLAVPWQGQWEQNRVPSVITEIIAKETSNVPVMATVMQPGPGSLAIPDLV